MKIEENQVGLLRPGHLQPVFAAPRDMGFYGSTESAGRYTPWRDPANHARFREDLIKLLDRVLAGEAPLRAGKPEKEATLARLPAFSLTGLDGQPVSPASLAGRREFGGVFWFISWGG